MNSRGPWWLGAVIGIVLLAAGIAVGRLALEAGGVLVIVVSVGRYLLLGR